MSSSRKSAISADSVPEPRNGTELQMRLLREAQAEGWFVQMTRRSHMCRTESDSGFPDLILSGFRTLILIECKSKGEHLTDKQEEWHRRIAAAGIEVYVYRPDDLDLALTMLKEHE